MSLSQINGVVVASSDGRLGRAGMPVSSIYPRFVLRNMAGIIGLHASETTKVHGLW